MWGTALRRTLPSSQPRTPGCSQQHRLSCEHRMDILLAQVGRGRRPSYNGLMRVQTALGSDNVSVESGDHPDNPLQSKSLAWRSSNHIVEVDGSEEDVRLMEWTPICGECGSLGSEEIQITTDLSWSIPVSWPAEPEDCVLCEDQGLWYIFMHLYPRRGIEHGSYVCNMCMRMYLCVDRGRNNCSVGSYLLCTMWYQFSMYVIMYLCVLILHSCVPFDL